jgi:uncharacterized protein (TIGR02391 family)
MVRTSAFDAGFVERICRVVGDTACGLSGRQIADLLGEMGLQDPGPLSKWDRLRQPLLAEQRRTGSGNCVLSLVQRSMQPVRWRDASAFEDRRFELNRVLAFEGIELTAGGELRRVTAAATHDEVHQRVRRLRAQLEQRGCHPEVLRYCTREILAEDYFAAVFEGVKGLTQRIRDLSGLDEDGHKLVDRALLGTSPGLAINSLRTSTERNEQMGLAHVIKGVYSAFRSPAAHDPRLVWDVSEKDALDLFSMLSLVHRRLDDAVRVPHSAQQQ